MQMWYGAILAARRSGRPRAGKGARHELLAVEATISIIHGPCAVPCRHQQRGFVEKQAAVY